MRHILAGMLLLALQPGVSSPQGRSRRAPDTSSQVIVGLRTETDLDGVLQGRQIASIGAIPGAMVHLFQLPRGWSPSEQTAAISSLRSDPRVRLVERNFRVGAPEAAGCNVIAGPGAQPCTEAVVSGSPTSQEFYDQTMISRLNVPAAQQLLTGFSSLVAVIDTGIDPTHALFQGRLWSAGRDFVSGRPFAVEEANGRDDDGDGLVDEGYGHGTHVAGTIVLINPEALILPLRVLDSDGNGTAFNVASAIYEAVFSGVDVINLSLSMTRPSIVVAEAVSLALDQGIDVFAAAGNSAGPVLFPARLDGVVAVGAVNDQDLKADFSAFGPEVVVCAPGIGIFSAYPGNRFAWWSGTSMACAVASGTASLTVSVAALNLQVPPSEALPSTSVPIDSLNPAYSGLLGDGRIDAYGAVLAALGGGSGSDGDGPGD